MFSAGRLSGRRRRGPRGAGACWGHERVGTSAGRESGPRSRPRPAVPGGCARPCRRVGSCGGGCPAPTGRSHVCVCGGPRVVSGRQRDGENASLPAQLCLGCGARWGPFAARFGRVSFRLPAGAGNAIHTGLERRARSGAQNSGGRGRSESFISQGG